MVITIVFCITWNVVTISHSFPLCTCRMTNVSVNFSKNIDPFILSRDISTPWWTQMRFAFEGVGRQVFCRQQNVHPGTDFDTVFPPTKGLPEEWCADRKTLPWRQDPAERNRLWRSQTGRARGRVRPFIIYAADLNRQITRGPDRDRLPRRAVR